MNLHTEVKNTFPRIKKRFDEEGLKEFASTPADEVLVKYDFLSSWIRIFVLKPKSRVFKAFKEIGVDDEETMSGTILFEFHKYIKETE